MLSTPDICCSMGVATDSATALRHAGSLSAPERARLLERHAAGCNLTNEVSVSISSGTEAGALRAEDRQQLRLAVVAIGGNQRFDRSVGRQEVSLCADRGRSPGRKRCRQAQRSDKQSSDML